MAPVSDPHGDDSEAPVGPASNGVDAVGTEPPGAASPTGPASAPRPSATRGAMTLMGGTLASRITGLVRNSLLNQLFGPAITDAFTVAFKVPNLFRELLAEGALSNAFVPIYKQLEGEDAKRFAGALLGVLVVANGLLLLLAEALAPWIVTLLLGAEGSVDAELALRLTRAVFPFLAMISFSAWAMGVLNAEERFFAPAWAPVAFNAVAVAMMLAFPEQALPLALAFVLGGLAQFLVQLPALRRHGLLPRFGGWWHPKIAATLLLMVPFAFTTGGRQFLNVIATRILDTLPVGSQTAYLNAELFLSLALGLFSISPALAFYSRLSDEAVRAPERFASTLQEGLRFIAFLCAPAGLLLWLLAEPAVRVVFDNLSVVGGGLDPARFVLTVAATAPLGFAVLPLGLVNLLLRTFYVRERVRAPIAITVVYLAVQATLFALLAPRFGIAGMTWGTAIGATLQAAALLVLVARREPFGVMEFLEHLGRVVLAAVVAVSAVALLLALVDAPPTLLGSLLEVALGGVVGLGLYAGIGAAIGLEQVGAVLRRLRR